MDRYNNSKFDISKLPSHVAVIMDGNGRWATKRGLPRTEGHRQGSGAVRKIVRHARKIGIKGLTLFAFSEQNWLRPIEEVHALMQLFDEYIEKEREEVINNGIRLYTIGDIAKLPKNLQIKLNKLEEDSSHNNDMKLGLAVSFGGREEIIHAIQQVCHNIMSGRDTIENLNVEHFSKYLFSYPLGDVDLLIRTGGERRISNFMLWEAAYAELYFTDVLWPDFDEIEFDEALEDFMKRQRRFGRV